MYSDILKLVLIILAIVVMLWLKKPLYWAIGAGIIVNGVAYLVPPLKWLEVIRGVITNWGSMSIILNIYLFTFLQRMLQNRAQIKKAQEDLMGLFNSRKVNATATPIVIGLLPSPAVMILCGEIVNEAAGEYLDAKEKAFCTTWFRHIPESFLPTYAGVLLLTGFSGIPVGLYALGMIPPAIALFAIGYLFFLRKVPSNTGVPSSGNKMLYAVNLAKHLWTLISILVLIMVFGIRVEIAVSSIIVLGLIVYRFTPNEIIPMLRRSVDVPLLFSSYLILVFQRFTTYTGTIMSLPEFFKTLPLPMYLMFALLFLMGGILSGSRGIIAMCAPMAFVAMPDGGLPLVVLLGCFTHMASQMSPTHVCLAVAAESFKINMWDLMKKTIPCAFFYCTFAVLYYHFLTFIL